MVLPALLPLAWYGWRRQRRHWSGWPLLLPAAMVALVVALAAGDTA